MPFEERRKLFLKHYFRSNSRRKLIELDRERVENSRVWKFRSKKFIHFLLHSNPNHFSWTNGINENNVPGMAFNNQSSPFYIIPFWESLPFDAFAIKTILEWHDFQSCSLLLWLVFSRPSNSRKKPGALVAFERALAPFTTTHTCSVE